MRSFQTIAMLLLVTSFRPAYNAVLRHLEQNPLNTRNEGQNHRYRRDIMEGKKFYSKEELQSNKDSASDFWIPEPFQIDYHPPDLVINESELKQALPLFNPTERSTNKSTSRGVRDYNENWVKLPFPDRDDAKKDLLPPPQPSDEFLNSRMPRVNFVTQNKVLDYAESRDDENKNQKYNSINELKADFFHSGVDSRARTDNRLPNHRKIPSIRGAPLFDEHYNNFIPVEDYYRKDPWHNDWYGHQPPYDTSDYYYNIYFSPDNYARHTTRKPKRVIYYANLPEVVRTPPNVDLRYRYNTPRQTWGEHVYTNTVHRYDNRYKSRNPISYSSYEVNSGSYRDMNSLGTTIQDKVTERNTTIPEMRTTPSMPRNDDFRKKPTNPREHMIPTNSNQFTDRLLPFDFPLFQRNVNGPFSRN